MSKNRYLGQGVRYDVYKNEVTFKLSFLNVDKMQFLEDMITSGKDLVIEITEQKRRSKSNAQLRRYHGMLKSVLVAEKIRPTPKRVKGLDTYVKENLIECDTIDFEEGFDENGEPIIRRIILPPSKANMSIEELNDLMNRVEEKFSHLNIDWQTGEIINE